MKRHEEADDIDGRVAALPRPTLDAAAGARIHARAREAFLGSADARAAPAPSGPWARLWRRALEPAAVAIAVAVYLLWATQALAALDWGRLALPPMNRVDRGAAAGGPQTERLARDTTAPGPRR